LLQDNLKKVQVYTEGTAYMITDVLKGTMDMPYGTGRGLDISGQQAAGKTGTANDSKDTWFCGYTPYYTTAVWIGYDTPRAMPGIYGATVSGRIWNRIMSEIHEGLPEKDWRQPSSVIEAWVDYDTGAQVSYNSGIRDYFNTAVNPAAKSAYEAVNGTSEYDPNAYRWREEDTLPESSSSEEDT
ncbi:MAG: penicillin-binding transpeptidase domain-containing protein, partial [Lachnospiraceae bacterium]